MTLRTFLLMQTALICVFFRTHVTWSLPLTNANALANHYVLKAKTLSKQHKKKDALIYYQKALTFNPGSARIVYAMAQICKDINLFERAAKLYNQAIALDPNNISILFDAANMFTMLNEFDKALALYQKILILDAKAIEALHNYAYALQKKGLIAQAIDIYLHIITKHPNYALAHISLALAYLSVGDFEHGWQEYEWRWNIHKKEPKKLCTPPQKELLCTP